MPAAGKAALFYVLHVDLHFCFEYTFFIFLIPISVRYSY